MSVSRLQEIHRLKKATAKRINDYHAKMSDLSTSERKRNYAGSSPSSSARSGRNRSTRARARADRKKSIAVIQNPLKQQSVSAQTNHKK